LQYRPSSRTKGYEQVLDSIRSEVTRIFCPLSDAWPAEPLALIALPLPAVALLLSSVPRTSIWWFRCSWKLTELFAATTWNLPLSLPADEPLVDPAVEPGLEPGVDPAVEPGVEPGVDPGALLIPDCSDGEPPERITAFVNTNSVVCALWPVIVPALPDGLLGDGLLVGLLGDGLLVGLLEVLLIASSAVLRHPTTVISLPEAWLCRV
jgi:hypothetical protein